MTYFKRNSSVIRLICLACLFCLFHSQTRGQSAKSNTGVNKPVSEGSLNQENSAKLAQMDPGQRKRLIQSRLQENIQASQKLKLKISQLEAEITFFAQQISQLQKQIETNSDLTKTGLDSTSPLQKQLTELFTQNQAQKPILYAALKMDYALAEKQPGSLEVGPYSQARQLHRILTQNSVQVFKRNLEEIHVIQQLQLEQQNNQHPLTNLWEEKKSEKLRRDQKLVELRQELQALQHDQEALQIVLKEMREVSKEIPQNLSVKELPPDDHEREKILIKFNFAKKKGQLPFPMDGKLLRTYRSQIRLKHQISWLHGSLILNGDNAPVRSMAPGRVVFAQELHGYKSVVILSHGQENYSVYGHLGQIDVNVGDYLDSRQVLGSPTWAEDKKQFMIYLEIRLNGTPVDPKDWLQKQ